MHARPRLPKEGVAALVKDVYGLDVGGVKEMNSYDDRIYMVRLTPDTPLPANISHVCPSGYALKVLNATDSINEDVIDIQTHISLHAKSQGFPTPCPVLNVDGGYQKLVALSEEREDEGAEQERCVVRMFEYIPGTTLESVPLTLDLCEETGEFAARMDVALETFSPKYPQVLQKMVNKWNLSEVPRLVEILHVITDSEQRSIVAQVFQQFESKVLTCQHLFTKGLIHGDFNDGNILVNKKPEGSPEDFKHNIVGIIDFGDCTQSLLVFEAAIAIMYAMLNKHSLDPMEAAAKLLAGYMKHRKLSKADLNIVKLSICARFAQSYTMGLYALSLNPEDQWVMHHAARIWPHLSGLWARRDEDVLAALTKYCSPTD